MEMPGKSADRVCGRRRGCTSAVPQEVVLLVVCERMFGLVEVERHESACRQGQLLVDERVEAR